MAATAMTAAQKVSAYIKLRDFKKSAEDEFKKSLQRTNDAMDKLEAELLDELNKMGVNSLASDAGTVYKNTQLSATVENREVFKTYCEENDMWEAMDIKANKTFVKEMMEKTQTVPPGLKVTQLQTVGIRRS
jgi:spore coat protein CotF